MIKTLEYKEPEKFFDFHDMKIPNHRKMKRDEIKKFKKHHADWLQKLWS